MLCPVKKYYCPVKSIRQKYFFYLKYFFYSALNLISGRNICSLDILPHLLWSHRRHRHRHRPCRHSRPIDCRRPVHQSCPLSPQIYHLFRLGHYHPRWTDCPTCHQFARPTCPNCHQFAHPICQFAHPTCHQFARPICLLRQTYHCPNRRLVALDRFPILLSSRHPLLFHRRRYLSHCCFHYLYPEDQECCLIEKLLRFINF